LICDDGTVVYDSNVICEYLDELHAGTRLIPRDASARWHALKMQALAQGISDAGIAARWETERRPAHVRWPVMHDGQIEKIAAACDFLERKLALGGLARGGESNAARCVAPAVDSATGFGAAPDIGDIALATALSWIEFRGVYPFLKGRPQLGRWYDAISARPSMLATALAGETQD
jgi:glutathione S-transferase